MGLSWVGLCAVGRWRSGPSQDGASLKGHHTTHRHTRLALNQTARRHHRCALRFHNKLTSTSPSLASTLKPESNDRSPLQSAAPDRPASRAAPSFFSFAAKEASSPIVRRERIRESIYSDVTAGRQRGDEGGSGSAVPWDFLGNWGDSSHLSSSLPVAWGGLLPCLSLETPLIRAVGSINAFRDLGIGRLAVAAVPPDSG